jgi:hypothetical protein
VKREGIWDNGKIKVLNILYERKECFTLLFSLLKFHFRAVLSEGRNSLPREIREENNVAWRKTKAHI